MGLDLAWDLQIAHDIFSLDLSSELQGFRIVLGHDLACDLQHIHEADMSYFHNHRLQNS